MKSQSHKNSFADKLNRLFELKPKADNSEYTHEEVYKETGITVGAISKLRTGRTINPGFRVIQALATFFEVSPSYFFADVNDELSAESAEQPDPYIDAIALRASSLSQSGRRALLGMLEHIIELEEGFEQIDEEAE